MADNDYMNTQEVLTGIKTWVKKEIGTNIYDISANHNGTKYANLAAALDSNNGGGVPQSLQKGGMSVKFVSNIDNKYVQYRLISDTFNTTPANWQGVDDKPTSGSENLIKSGGVENLLSFSIYRNVISNEIYNDDNGKPMSYSNCSRTGKMPIISGEVESNYKTCGSYAEVLFWSNNTYLGYSRNSLVEPSTWVAQDHTLPVTHIAMCWVNIASNFYYKSTKIVLDSTLSKEISDLHETVDDEIESVGIKTESVAETATFLNTERDIVANSAWNDEYGTPTGYIGRSRTSKMKYFGSNAKCSDGVYQYLFWSNSTYLGYSTTSIVSPTTWVVEDHTLPITHIAFNFLTVVETFLYINKKIALQEDVDNKADSSVVNALDNTVDSLSSQVQAHGGLISSQGESIAGIEGNIDGIEESIAGIEGNIATLSDAISEIGGEVPSGTVGGNNVWTGTNTFTQTPTSVAGNNENNLVILSQLHNATTANRFVNAKDYGFKVGNTPSDNADALQDALNNGNVTVVVSEPGIYELSKTVLLYDNTELMCGKGVYFKKAATYTNMFRNAGATTRSTNKNITLRGVNLIINNYGMATTPTSDIYGLRGEVAFLCTDNVKIYDFICEDLYTAAYGIMFNQSTNFIIDGAILKGRKDGIHISAVDSFVIRNIVCQTYDDALALNACDWISSNCVNGDILNGIIENVTDEYLSPTSGFMCRLLVGAWTDWSPRMSIKRGDTVVNNGRIYRAIVSGTSGDSYTSQTEPTIETFTGVQADTGGFDWKLMRNDKVYYSCNIRNVEFRNIKKYSTRRGFSEEVDIDGTWNRSLYPSLQYSNYPKVEISVKGYYIERGNAFFFSPYCNTFDVIESMNGECANINLSSPVNSALTKHINARDIDFREASGTMLTTSANTKVNLNDCIYGEELSTSASGSINSNCNLSSLPSGANKGDMVIYQQEMKYYNGNSWVSMTPSN